MEALVLDNNSTHSKTDSITRTIRSLTKREEELAASKETLSILNTLMVSRRHPIILSPVTHPLSLLDHLVEILLQPKEHSQTRLRMPISSSMGTIQTSASKITIRIMSTTKIQNLSTSSRWKTLLAVEILLKKMLRHSGRFARVRILTKTRYTQTPGSSRPNKNSLSIRLCPPMRNMIWISAKADANTTKMMVKLNKRRTGLQLTDQASGMDLLPTKRLRIWILRSKRRLWIGRVHVRETTCSISRALTIRATSWILPVLINYSLLVREMLLKRRQKCMPKYTNKFKISKNNNNLNSQD